MTIRFIVSTSLAIMGIALGAAYEAREVIASRVELTRLQRTTDALAAEVMSARKANNAANSFSIAAHTAAEAASSPFAPTGDVAFDAEERETLRHVYALKKWFDRNTAEWIPEIRDVSDIAWFDAVSSLSPWNDSKLPSIARHLRRNAQLDFIGSVYYALDHYLGEHDGILPKDLRELTPYFGGACDEEALARYRMAASGRMSEVPAGKAVMSELMSPAEQQTADITEYETLKVQVRTVDPLSHETNFGRKRSVEMFAAIHAYREAHNGAVPTDAQQLKPYVSDPSVLEGVKLEENGYTVAGPTYSMPDGNDRDAGVIESAISQYLREHEGKMPTNAQELSPYVPNPSVLKSLKIVPPRGQD